MPNGKVHDAITLLLIPPVFGAAYLGTGEIIASSVVTAAFLFGGLMFGPDLDTASKQYSRWSIFRFLWFPYRSFFRHRSRWSHGLIFGTMLRVVYFIGVLTLTGFLLLYAWMAYTGGAIPRILEFAQNWRSLGMLSDRYFEFRVFPAVFIGMWTGAASHTFTDMAVSYVKTGRVTEFL